MYGQLRGTIHHHGTIGPRQAGPEWSPVSRAASSGERERSRWAEGESLIGRTDENGTFVAKRMIHEPTPLADGDEVRVGSEVLSFHKGQGPGSTETG